MDFSRWITFCLGLVAVMALAFSMPCLCKTAHAAEKFDETRPCCPGDDGEDDSACGCGCSAAQDDGRTELVEGPAQAVVQKYDHLVPDEKISNGAAKALLFVWFAQFVEASNVEGLTTFESPPLLATKSTNFLDLRVLRL